MKIFIVLFATIAVALGGLVKVDDRIIGGEETTIEQHPYQISLRYYGDHNCGGSIVNENTIITAAHCVHRTVYERITVRIGSTIHHEGEEFNPSKIIVHPEYDVGGFANNDIAIMKFNTPFKFSDKVQPIELQPEGVEIKAGTIAYASGWGTTNAGVQTSPEELRVVDLKVVSNEECNDSYNGRITSTMLCAGAPGKDSCNGDSGGPLVANGKLIGIVSWNRGCAYKSNPGAYANVSALHEFADQYL